MAIVTPPPPAASWRDAAMARSVIITDAWEVTKTYAGRIAEWVLFLCMVANIIEMLPGVVVFPIVSNLVLGTQVVMLDVGGFSLTSMADHAREQGDEKAARRASITGGFLIGIMIATLLLVSIGLLWHEAKYYTDIAEKGLILVRVVMTVIYGHVIHSLRRRDDSREQQAAETRLQEITSQFTGQLDQVQTSLVQSVEQMVHRGMDAHMLQVEALVQQVVHEALEHAPFTTTDQVESAIQEFAVSQLQPRIEQGQSALLEQIHARLERMTQEIKQGLHHQDPTLHMVPSGGSPGSREGAQRPTKKVRTLVPVVQSHAQIETGSEPSDEPVHLRVTRFIQMQLNQGHKPSLSEIMDHCQCSRNTAIRYRRESLGTDEEERSA